jgi:hypothetical protein
MNLFGVAIVLLVVAGTLVLLAGDERTRARKAREQRAELRKSDVDESAARRRSGRRQSPR